MAGLQRVRGVAARVRPGRCSRSSTAGLFDQQWLVFSKTGGVSQPTIFIFSTRYSLSFPLGQKERKKEILKKRANSDALMKLSTGYSPPPHDGEPEPRAKPAGSSPTVTTASQTHSLARGSPSPLPSSPEVFEPAALVDPPRAGLANPWAELRQRMVGDTLHRDAMHEHP